MCDEAACLVPAAAGVLGTALVNPLDAVSVVRSKASAWMTRLRMHDEARACLVASATAGILGTAIAHPFDTAAVLRSTGRPLPSWRNTHHLYRGLGAATLQGAVIFSVLLGCFEWFKGQGCTVPQAAVACAVPESVIRGPIEAWKNMTQTGYTVRGSQLGRALMLGTLGTFARETPGNVVYFSSFEYLRSSGFGPAVAGLCTGAAYTLAVYPIESVRTQYVTGIRPLRPTFRGSGPFLARSVFLTAFVQYFYESLLGKQMGHGMEVKGDKPVNTKPDITFTFGYGKGTSVFSEYARAASIFV
jgi:hypothetical protein